MDEIKICVQVNTYSSTLPSQIVIVHVIVVAGCAPMTTSEPIRIVTIGECLVQ